jgi:hypothetical protein
VARKTPKQRAIESARFLATKLTQVADALERAAPSDRDANRIALISALMKTDSGLAHSRADTEDNRLRDHFFALCRQMGGVVRHARTTAPRRRKELEASVGRRLPDNFPWVHPQLVENMAEMGIASFAMNAPEYEAKLRKSQRDVERLVDAYARGKSVTALRELICQAMGWTASGAAVRQAKSRARRRTKK